MIWIIEILRITTAADKVLRDKAFDTAKKRLAFMDYKFLKSPLPVVLLTLKLCQTNN